MKGRVKGKFRLLLFVPFILLLCTGILYAGTSVTVKNHFETGIVDLSLTELKDTRYEGGDKADHSHILPGDQISRGLQIHNNGSDCYVRVKIDISGTEEIDENSLCGISSPWIRADDGYLYYTKILRSGEDAKVFQGVNIPKELSKEMEEKNFSIEVRADGIQSSNFTPEFHAARPWGDVEILKCEKAGPYEIGTWKSSDARQFRITYEGDSEKLIQNSEDFFSNLPNLLPGDGYTESVEMVNRGEEEICLYFRSEVSEKSQLPDKILLKIDTEINGEKRRVYSGDLRAKALTENVNLGGLPPNTQGILRFEIQVPPGMDNQYTLSESQVQWIFSTEPSGKSSAQGVHTGDAAPVGFFISLLGISGMFLLTINFPKIRERKRGDSV